MPDTQQPREAAATTPATPGGHGHDHDHDHDHGEGGCEEALAELYTFLDDELTIEMRVRIERHLNDCSPCLEAFDFEAELRHVVRHRCRDQVPDDLRRRIADQIGQIFGDGAVEGAGSS